ncbi:hypothetical protein JW926_18935 [Candidatus Sumerlaeota bacterium]|nr:hypothetical protein [Candidatus Sumerlaeota bacterium]
MEKKSLLKKLFITASFFILGVSVIFLINGSKKFDKKITLIVTGGLSDIFHPFGEDSDNLFLRKRLDEIVGKSRKSYPDALLVDTGNYLSIPDFSETVYNTPALRHFSKHNYDVLNIGANEVMLEKSIAVSLFTSKNANPFFVSPLIYRSDKKNIVQLNVDTGDPQKPVRFLGTFSLSHEFSAPHLEGLFQYIPLSDIIARPPSPGLTILLSDLPHIENLEIAQSVAGIDLILESGHDATSPVSKVKNVFLCRRAEPDSVGLFQLERTTEGKIREITFKSYSLTEEKGFLWMSGRKIQRSVKKPPPFLGIMAEQESFLKSLSVEYDTHEIQRMPIGEYSSDALNSHVFVYELVHNQKLVARSLLVKHSLGQFRPFYFFFITFDLDNKVQNIDFISPPSFPFWDLGISGFKSRYLGKRWNEMTFDASGCLGALDEFTALHDDFILAAKFMESRFPQNKND